MLYLHADLNAWAELFYTCLPLRRGAHRPHTSALPNINRFNEQPQMTSLDRPDAWHGERQ